MTRWETRLERELQYPLPDPQLITHYRKMIALQAQHGGRECLCEPGSPCDYHLATMHGRVSS